MTACVMFLIIKYFKKEAHREVLFRSMKNEPGNTVLGLLRKAPESYT